MKNITLYTLIIYLAILIIGITASVRIVSLVITKGDYYKGNFDTARIVTEDRVFNVSYEYRTGIRGNMYSDDNELLLSTVYIYDLYWYPSLVTDSLYFMQNLDSLASIFHEITPHVTKQAYKKMILTTFHDYHKQYQIALHKIKSDDKQIKNEGNKELKKLRNLYKNIKISKATKAEECVSQKHWDKICSLFPSKASFHGGCKVDKRLIHKNVYKNTASATIGYLNIQHSSRFTDSIVYARGIEGYYDSLLAEERIVFRKLYANNVLIPLRENRRINPQNGCDIITTIDLDIQRISENALHDQLKDINASWGCAIVMEVQSGEIKAIVNLTRTHDGNYEETIDHAVTESYEPGSTFKLMTLLAALESGEIDTSTLVKCEENRIFSLKRAFEISDNEGLYNAAKLAYPQIYDFFLAIMNMSLQKDLHIEVANALSPVLTSKTQREIDYVNVTHGYSIKVPPIYMLAYYNAIANDGKYIQPILVKKIRYPHNKTIEKYARVINPKICSKSTVKKAKACLESVVTHGTGIRARDENYKTFMRDTSVNIKPLIAGKTGTAFIYDDKERQYSKSIKNASFIGYFPSEKPKYTCLVLISGTTLDGGYVAAPICKEIAEKIVNRDNEIAWSQTYKGLIANTPYAKFASANDLQNIYKELGYRLKYEGANEWGSTEQVNENKILSFEKKPINKHNLARQLIGATAKDAVYILKKNGFDIKIDGVGKVVSLSFEGSTAIVHLKNDAKR